MIRAIPPNQLSFQKFDVNGFHARTNRLRLIFDLRLLATGFLLLAEPETSNKENVRSGQRQEAFKEFN